MQSPKSNSKRKASTPKVEDSLGRIQPQELDFERSVLGALLIEKDAYSLVSEILTPEAFYDPKNQKVYRAIRTLNFANLRSYDLVREILKQYLTYHLFFLLPCATFQMLR